MASIRGQTARQSRDSNALDYLVFASSLREIRHSGTPRILIQCTRLLVPSWNKRIRIIKAAVSSFASNHGQSYKFELPIAIVDRVTKAGCVDDCQCKVHTVLLQQHFASLYGYGFLNPKARTRVLGAVYIGEEHWVDQSRFAQSRLPCKQAPQKTNESRLSTVGNGPDMRA